MGTSQRPAAGCQQQSIGVRRKNTCVWDPREAKVVLALMSAAEPTTTEAAELKGTVLEVLQALLTERRDTEVVALVAKLVTHNGELERRLSEILARRRKSEGISTAQLRLLLDGLSSGANDSLAEANHKLKVAADLEKKDEQQGASEKPQRQPPMRRPIPPDLKRVENPINVPADERACPACGNERACIGHDITEVIDLIPAQVVVRLDKREKLACTQCEGELARAPQGDKVVEGGRLGSALVSELIVDKYRDGLPLHRQKERLERLGLALPISTLADQVTWATDLLRPLWRAAKVGVLNATVMHIDATSLPVLDRDNANGIRLGSLWGCVGDCDLAFYFYASTGSKVGQRVGEIGPEELLAQRTGLVVADAAGIFDASFLRDDLIECGCNMHARRYFKKALDRGDTRAALPIGAFKRLYEIEESIRHQNSSDKGEERRRRSKPIFDELLAWGRTYRQQEPPASPLGVALRYLHNHQEALQRFLEDGRIPIDNGIVERLHIRAALTRKNFLFAGSDTGGERAAIAFTILGCCQLADVNPVEYLADVLPRLARGMRLRDAPAMLPRAWKEARLARAAPAAS
jgi:transposase